MFRSIVVGTDGSTTAATAVDAAAQLAEQSGARLHLVSAYSSLDLQLLAGATGVVPTPQHTGSLAAEEAKLMLEELALTLEDRGINLTVHPCQGPADDALLEVARVQGADLIVVGSRGMTGVRRVLGSVPNSVAHKAPCTVMIVKTA
jgi:nucleotide-binding universal stress UspA family protein